MAGKTREELEKDWWEAWWNADFSWDGLVSKHIAGDGGPSGERTLQSYWRRDPRAPGIERDDTTLRTTGELVDGYRADGTPCLWHIAHVPLHWKDGSPAKAGWATAEGQRLKDIVDARIGASAETRDSLFAGEDISGVDGRAQLVGAVLLHPPVHPDGPEAPMHIAAGLAYLPAWQAAGGKFGPAAKFTDAIFGGDTSFRSATFGGAVSFETATFLGTATFKFTTFSGDAWFRTATFASTTSFFDASFQKLALFVGASFSENTSFADVDFLGWGNFTRATFSGATTFSKAKFSQMASFDNASFVDLAVFENALFGGMTIFTSATFNRFAWFSDTAFSEKVYFGEVVFKGAADFGQASFAKLTTFSKAQFEADLHGRPAQSGIMTFNNAVFVGPVEFVGTRFSANPEDHAAAFRGASFKTIVDFGGSGSRWIAALDDATVEGRLLIDDPGEREALQQFDRSVLPAIVFEAPVVPVPAAPQLEGSDDGLVDVEAGLVAHGPRRDVQAADGLLKHLEGGCRTVKIAMGKARDELMEQRYYRFQLLARRHQSGTPWFEKAASRVYGAASDYGLSLTRPIASLGLVIAVFAALYLGFALASVGAAVTWERAGQALAMSMSRVFPFGAFESTSKDWTARALTTGKCAKAGNGSEALRCDVKESGWELVVRGLATLESLCAAILVFLFGLAVRRRFQIG